MIKLRSHWGVVSAGKFQATLKKIREHWDHLLNPSEDVPKNLQRWFEMEKETKNDEENEEEENELEIKQTKKKSRKRKDYNPILD